MSEKASGLQTRHDLQAALDAVLAKLQSQPSRTWSLIITFYGDALLPRGNSVWLGTLLSFFKELDVAEGVVRTAMSRLAADGWIERNRVGRNSYYRLAEKGMATFANAAERIYHPGNPMPASGYTMVMLPPRDDRQAVQAALEDAGFGSPSPNNWIAPAGRSVPEAAKGEIVLSVSGEHDDLGVLASRAWPLDDLAGHYRHFIEVFRPLLEVLEGGVKPSDAEAVVARILLIHEFRRIVLRDPNLPGDLLPPDWPGAVARRLCSALYVRLAPASERWLDANGLDENGALSHPVFDMVSRFNS